MKLKAPLFNYFWQLSLAGVFIFCVLIIFKDTAHLSVLWALGLSSIASSVFITFATPHTAPAEDHRVLTSYVLNMMIGSVTHYILQAIKGNQGILMPNEFLIFAVICAVAVTVSLTLMVLLDIKHPPALGACIVIIINMHDYQIIGVIALSAILLSILHFTLCRWLRNL